MVKDKRILYFTHFKTPVHFQIYTIAEECPPRILQQSNTYLSSDNLFHKAKSLGDNDEIFITNEFTFGNISEGISLDDPLYDNLEKTDNIANFTINTDEIHRNYDDMEEKGDYLVKDAANELELSGMRPTNEKITLNNEEQATGIMAEQANLEPFKERIYVDQVSKVYPFEKVNVIYASQDDQKENVDLQNSNQEYQKKQEIHFSPYFTLKENKNKEQNKEYDNEDSINRANVKEVDSHDYIISDKLDFESTEFNKNLRQNRQYTTEIKQKIPNTQTNKVSENEITNIYRVPPKLEIGHEKYLHSQESGLNPEYSIPKKTELSQATLDNPVVSHENQQFADDANQGAKDIENANLSNFHIIDSEKDLDVPDGLEGPVPAVALPPPFNGRGYVAVPFNGK